MYRFFVFGRGGIIASRSGAGAENGIPSRIYVFLVLGRGKSTVLRSEVGGGKQGSVPRVCLL